MNHRKVRKLSQFNFLNYRDEFKHRRIYEKKIIKYCDGNIYTAMKKSKCSIFLSKNKHYISKCHLT